MSNLANLGSDLIALREQIKELSAREAAVKSQIMAELGDKVLFEEDGIRIKITTTTKNRIDRDSYYMAFSEELDKHFRLGILDVNISELKKLVKSPTCIISEDGSQRLYADKI